MPEVRIQYDSKSVKRNTIAHISQIIGTIVAVNLSCDEFPLLSEDISLTFHQYGPDDRHKNQIEIFIDAFETPERLEKINAITNKIRDMILANTLSHTTFFVWIRLTKGGFAKS